MGRPVRTTITLYPIGRPVTITYYFVLSADDSGRWGKGGLFDALSARSTQPQLCYEQAGKMKDLALGDAHLIPIDDLQSREKGRDMVCKLANYSL